MDTIETITWLKVIKAEVANCEDVISAGKKVEALDTAIRDLLALKNLGILYDVEEGKE